MSSKSLRGNTGSRQIGFQETDVVGIFRPVTKYASLVETPDQLKYELQKATQIAKSDRPGPVIVDICEDVQFREYDFDSFPDLTHKRKEQNFSELERKVDEMAELIEQSKRPIVILGGGIRSGGALKEAREFIQRLNIPYTLTWAAMDYLPGDEPNFAGGFGVTSPRYGNFAVQNSDLVLAIGTRLDSHETGSDLSTFARDAKKIVVDVDPAEINKYASRGMDVDIPIVADVRDFFSVANKRANKIKVREISDWREKIHSWRKRYPVLNEKQLSQTKLINPYLFMNQLSEQSREGDIIVTDCGSNLIWTMQGFGIKRGQRVISAWNHSPMGYSLPASIGASLAIDGNPVTCITGDGGIQINIQELATIRKLNLPIKIFLANNHGHGIIQGTQDAWLDERHHASSPNHKLPDPDFEEIARAYGIPTESIDNPEDLSKKIRGVLNHEGPILCNINMQSGPQIEPKLLFGRPIEDSHPLLDRDTFREEMIVEPLPDNRAPFKRKMGVKTYYKEGVEADIF